MPPRELQMDVDVLKTTSAAPLVDVESQVILHCTLIPSTTSKARIWPTTYLIDHHSGNKSRLLHAEGIGIYPQWTQVRTGMPLKFTLVFEALPKRCLIFEMKEITPEKGAFYCKDILRKRTDIYNVDIQLQSLP